MKTGLKHNCAKAQSPASLKSLFVHLCVSTGVCRCVYASGLGTELRDSARPRNKALRCACLGLLGCERRGCRSRKWLTSSVSVSLQQLSKATEGDFSEGCLDIRCAALGDARSWKME